MHRVLTFDTDVSNIIDKKVGNSYFGAFEMFSATAVASDYAQKRDSL